MIEAGVVIDKDGQPLYWHLPSGRSGGALPDSKELWDVFWENRHNLSGFAHTHPGYGKPWPSDTDLSTFAAIENALGKSLVWWIATMDQLAIVKVVHAEYQKSNVPGAVKETQFSVWPQRAVPTWLAELRMLTDWPADGVMLLECEDCGWKRILREGERSEDVHAAHQASAH